MLSARGHRPVALAEAYFRLLSRQLSMKGPVLHPAPGVSKHVGLYQHDKWKCYFHIVLIHSIPFILGDFEHLFFFLSIRVTCISSPVKCSYSLSHGLLVFSIWFMVVNYMLME